MQNSVASSGPLAQPPVRAMWGVFDRKERWSLSWRGRLILASAALLVGALCVKGVYPFLAVTNRVGADVLVVEGWVHEYTIRAAVENSGLVPTSAFSNGGTGGGNWRIHQRFLYFGQCRRRSLKKERPGKRIVQEVPSRVWIGIGHTVLRSPYGTGFANTICLCLALM